MVKVKLTMEGHNRSKVTGFIYWIAMEKSQESLERKASNALGSYCYWKKFKRLNWNYAFLDLEYYSSDSGKIVETNDLNQGHRKKKCL